MSKPPNEVLKQYGNGVHGLGNDGVTILHQSVHEGNANIIGFLLDSVQAGGHTHTVSGMLLAHDKYRRNAWHMAALEGNLQVLGKLWKCANENLTRVEISNELLLATDDKGRTVWQVAVKDGKLGVLQKIWDWAEGILTERALKVQVVIS
jgi:ankyrin repeat protein